MRWSLGVLGVCLAAAAFAQTGTQKDVEVYGQKIHYVEAGSGPVIVLVHGLGVDANSWALNIGPLSAKYHVYALDQIGFGRSDKPMIPYRVATLVDFLNGFFQKLGISKATVVGNSLGGWTVAAFTLAHPERVEKLVLVDSAGYSPKRIGAAPLTREAIEVLRPSTLAGMRQVLNIVLHNHDMITDAMVEQSFTAKLKSNDGYTVSQFIESLLRGEDTVDGKLGAVKAPTLIVWGQYDMLTPPSLGKAFAEDIGGSRLVTIENCGHAPQLECAAVFNRELMKFLDGAPTGGGQ